MRAVPWAIALFASTVFGFSHPAHSEDQVRARATKPPQSASAAQGPSGKEWMASAPPFCGSYEKLNAKQISICDEAAFRFLSKNWENVTAANGQVYEIAVDTIMRDLPANVAPRAVLRAATVVVYIYEGEIFKPKNVVHFYFDCRDQFQTFQGNWSQASYVPPLSVAAKIASFACVEPMRAAAAIDKNGVAKRYVHCLASNTRSGRYRSLAAEQAILKLTVDCMDQREAYAEHCAASGGPFHVPYCDGGVCVRTAIEECRLRAGLLAAVAIKLNNNALGQNYDDLVEQLNSAAAGKPKQ